MSAEAATARPGWADVLPRLSPEEIDVRRRVGPLLARLGRWGPRFSDALPRALAGLWPGEAQEPGGPVLRLELSGSDLEPHELTFDRYPVRIGRGEGCALQLSSPAVSTEHAELQLEGDQVILMDLRSTNGTKHNSEPLTPFSPAALGPGDLVEIGPFVLTLRGLEPVASGPAVEIHATPPSPMEPERLFVSSHPSDRWVRVRWAEETAWLRVPAGWIRASWRRASDLEPRDGDDVDPMEEGAAQYLLVQIARALARETGHDLDLSAWLNPEEARRAARPEGPWLQCEVWLRGGGVEVATSLLFPAPEPPPSDLREALSSLLWPATVCLGVVRLKLAVWRGVDPGDALLPDEWWPTGWAAGGAETPEDLGRAFVRVRRAWHAGQLQRSEAGVSLRLESPWLDTPGGNWLMAEEDALGAAAPSSLPVDDLELQVAIELDRFPVRLGELQRWREGEVLYLRQGPSDPVRLVVETGLERRILAEGRVTLVNDRLGIEILRILTRLDDTAPRR
jgi:flagellar motor switch/type III secretory pathway protein FliN